MKQIDGRVQGSFGAGQAKTTTTIQTPTEAADTLQSNQFAWIVDLLSEGPIVGLCDRNWNSLLGNPGAFGMAVFFNETQLMTDSGQLNFQGVQVGQLQGYDNQGTYTNFSTSGDTVSVGVNLLAGIPITVGIEDPNTTRVSVGIRYPQLELQDDKGNIGAYNVTVYIYLSLNGGVFALAGAFNLAGKCSTDYVREYNIVMPRSANPANDYWQIQVQRQSPDDPDSKHRSPTIFDYYTRVTDANLIYPGSAYAVVGISATAMSSIPVRGYRLKGRMVSVPSNYYPDARTYSRYYVNGGDTGVQQPWNGTFYQAWTNNPAWVFYDICTNTRYGAGNFIGSNIDIWTLYEIAQYCDEYVPDGHGGFEPRFTLNTYVQTQEQAWKVLSDFASCFRGLLYWGGGTIVPVQDRPKPMLQVFTNANVVNAVFSYSDTEIKNRQSDATVTWNDPADFFNTKLERVTNMDARRKFGTREAQFAAFGCTSRGQASRSGNYFLTTNQTETETVVFQAGLEAMYLRPGDIIGISDNDRIGFRSGGRIVSIAPAYGALQNSNLSHTGVYLTLDSYIPARPDTTLIWLYAAQDSTPLFAGSYESKDIAPGNPFGSEVAEHVHTSLMQGGFIYGMGGGSQNTIYFQPFQTSVIPPIGSPSAAFPVDEVTAPYGTPMVLPASIGPGSIWVLSSNLVTPEVLPVATFRVIDITEKETHIIEVTGVTYNAGKYNEVDFGIQFEKPLLTALPPINYVLAPNSATSKLVVTASNESVVIAIQVDWQEPPDSTVRSYRLAYSINGGTMIYLVEQVATTYTWNNATPATYTFQIQAVNFVSVASLAATTSILVPDIAHFIPHRVSGLELAGQGGNTIYNVLEPVLDWRLNSPVRAFNMNSAEPYGANTGAYDPYFVNFEITIIDANTGITGWVTTTTDLTYQITQSHNATAWGDGKSRHRLIVRVKANNSYNVPAPIEEIVIDNPPPAPVQFLSAVTGESRITLSWITTYVQDLALINIYKGTNLSLSGAVLIATESAHSTTFTTGPLTTGTYFFGVTQVDTFGSESKMSAPATASVS